MEGTITELNTEIFQIWFRCTAQSTFTLINYNGIRRSQIWKKKKIHSLSVVVPHILDKKSVY